MSKESNIQRKCKIQAKAKHLHIVHTHFYNIFVLSKITPKLHCKIGKKENIHIHADHNPYSFISPHIVTQCTQINSTGLVNMHFLT